MKKVLIGVLLAAFLISLATAMAANEKNSPEKKIAEEEFYAGRPVKLLKTEDSYSLIDLKTGETVLYVNQTEIEENLNGSPAITKEQAIKLASQLCGSAYTLVRATENPYDFDILFERQVSGITVFGETCYVSVNKMTGKIAAYRKMPVREINFKPEVKISKDEVIRMTDAMDAKLILIPEIGVFWITSTPGKLINAVTGEEVSEKVMEKLKRIYVTTVDLGNLTEKAVTIEGSFTIKGIDNDQGAVFRDETWYRKDDIDAAEESMETPRPNNQPAWDSNAIDYDIVNYESTVNYILDNYEAVYFAGHGNDNCIALGGDAQYCKDEVANNRDTRLFVIAACKAGNNLAPTLANKGVQCVIGATETITDLYGLGECATWAALFWDRATGNIFAGSQRTAHEARIEANTITYLPSFMDCDLDAEKGNCNIYI